MYLSKLTLNLRNHQVRSEIASPYEMHRTLLKAYVKNEATTENRILFRIEPPQNRNISAGVNILVQSNTIEPNWNNILSINQNYFLTEPKTKKVELKYLHLGLYKFKTTVNPTIKRNHKRYGLYKEEEQIAWLVRKGENHGFIPILTHCNSFTIGNKTKTSNAKNNPIRKSDIYHLGVNYEGILNITNSQKFLDALASGIGSAKAFGFGLLTISKID